VDAVRSVNTLALASASIALLIAVAVAGVFLAPASTLPFAGPMHERALCEHEPLVSTSEMATLGLAQFCVSEDDVRAWVELLGSQRGTFYTGWLIYGNRSLFSRGSRCGRSTESLSGSGQTPLRIDHAIADEAGRARFMASYPALRLSDKEDVWILVVDHGVLPSGDKSITAWEPGWWSTASAVTRGSSIAGQLTGCAHFQRRRGVESLE
jgi:hypothetical protein